MGHATQERIEAVEHVPEGSIKLVSEGCQCPASDNQVNQFGISDVVRGIFRKPRVKQYFGCGRSALPHQTHMNRFGTLHWNERRHLSTYRAVEAGFRPLGIGSSAASKQCQERSDRYQELH